MRSENMDTGIANGWAAPNPFTPNGSGDATDRTIFHVAARDESGGAIGTVTNLASRLCGEAKPGQILVPQRFVGAVENLIELESVGELKLKGFQRAVTAYNILSLKA